VCISEAKQLTFFSHLLSSALERTYLAYLRTSLALSNIGVVIAQLFSLTQQQGASSNAASNPKVKTGLPLAVVFIVAAIVVMSLGAIRFWRQQTAMARNKVWAGGFEIYLIMFVAIGVSSSAFRRI
jgi:uncharacterized membrane protein YidH (DUF202 family)